MFYLFRSFFKHQLVVITVVQNITTYIIFDYINTSVNVNDTK